MPSHQTDVSGGRQPHRASNSAMACRFNPLLNQQFNMMMMMMMMMMIQHEPTTQPTHADASRLPRSHAHVRPSTHVRPSAHVLVAAKRTCLSSSQAKMLLNTIGPSPQAWKDPRFHHESGRNRRSRARCTCMHGAIRGSFFRHHHLHPVQRAEDPGSARGLSAAVDQRRRQRCHCGCEAAFGRSCVTTCECG